MTTEIVSVADILRPLAEGKVGCPEGPPQGTPMTQPEPPRKPLLFRHWAKCTGGCGGTGKVLDPRFDALRCRHPGMPRFSIAEGEPWTCRDCHEAVLAPPTGWVLRVDLGAIVEAARASGREVFMAVVKALFLCYDSGEDIVQAAARALVAAVGEE